MRAKIRACEKIKLPALRACAQSRLVSTPALLSSHLATILKVSRNFF